MQSNKFCLIWNCPIFREGYIGYFNLEYIDNITSEISYGVISEFTGLGIGTFIVRSATTILDKKIVAWVADDNIPSIKMF